MKYSILLLSYVVASVGASPKLRSQNEDTTCSPLEVLVARGTGEPGKYGAIVGDALVTGVEKSIKGATAYAVNYPASINRNSTTLGQRDVVRRLSTQPKLCPNQKYALVGYSQGATVMHMAAANISLDVFPRVVALVMFGDPAQRDSNARIRQFPAYLGSRLRENCAEADPVCSDAERTNVLAHLIYNDKDTSYMRDSIRYITDAFNSKTGTTVAGAPQAPPPFSNATTPSSAGTNTTTPLFPAPGTNSSLTAPPTSPNATDPKQPGNPKGPTTPLPSPKGPTTPKIPTTPKTVNQPKPAPTPKPASSPRAPNPKLPTTLPDPGSNGAPKGPSDPFVLNPPQSIPQTAPLGNSPVDVDAKWSVDSRAKRRVGKDSDVLWNMGGLVSGRRVNGGKGGVLREGWA